MIGIIDLYVYSFDLLTYNFCGRLFVNLGKKWERKDKAMCERGMRHPDYDKRL